ncbi:16S rRNA (uracil(1498)-N(3))-methyltransferase [Frateuria aurantia]|uniref:Ribosomal RNA small subunit methyltransferase E n=1 Tax=Frateuria aurantia (strain ATCC 33424 / DSM 6220 / KCTC 2777 / LMG 1558 / NBRC 3245 / NCIMB 13370) TaxID=767434 RepID=H8L5N6_FRAAD|nr:16S rRNA (uracil(1498)-N(3))-methyltransferase [Frateuria aurantia]AFC86690.1 RNA methyltransferase, RsmE family [Frateuria aurantia DSM 6220]
MRTIRIHIDSPLSEHGSTVLEGQPAEHLVRVLRQDVGAQVVLFNGDGHDYAATITAVERRQVQLQIATRHSPGNESPLRLTLAQGIARGEKMDLIIQKACELGIAEIVPLHTERSEVRLDEKRSAKRLEHWQAVAISAAEQSGRAMVPVIHPARPLAVWLDSLPAEGPLRLSLSPDGEQRLRQLQLPASGAMLMVGPEGGLGERDLEALDGKGFQRLQLGPRILRTETAGLAAAAALQAVHGDF